MNLDELIPPEDDKVFVSKNGAVVASVDTIMRWTDDWLKTAEFRQMLSKAVYGQRKVRKK